jgi:hypothetical protein
MKSKQLILLVFFALSLNIVSAKLYPKKELTSRRHIFFAGKMIKLPSGKTVSQIDCDFENVKVDYEKSQALSSDKDNLIPVIQEECPKSVMITPHFIENEICFHKWKNNQFWRMDDDDKGDPEWWYALQWLTNEEKEGVTSCYKKYNTSIRKYHGHSTCEFAKETHGKTRNTWWENHPAANLHNFECNIINDSLNETHYDSKVLRVSLKTKWIKLRPFNEKDQKSFENTLKGCVENVISEY